MKFNTVLTILGLSAMISCSQQQEDVTKPKMPNIVYVLADDLGIGDINAFNPEGKIKTPHIDKLANEGMKFTDAHTSSSVCTPTRYGILTGRYNWRSRLKAGVLWGYSPGLIDTARTTVPAMLSEQGYHTAFIGKWHLGWNWGKNENDEVDYTLPITHNPNDVGFDYSYGHVASLDIPPYIYVEDGKVTAVPNVEDSTVNTGKYSWWRNGLTAPDFDHEDVTPNFFRRSMKYIEERAKTDDPFFLYLALPSPHTPILPLEEWQDKSGLNPYADFVMMIDDYMGQLAKTIKDAGIEENTIVIFTSDNGCSPAAKISEMTEKGHYPSYIFRGHKADIYEGGHRVPFLVKWPSTVKPGSVSKETICTTDLLATAADITSYEVKDNMGEDSYSFLPVLKGEKLESSLREATVHSSINGSFAIRKGDWKLIMGKGSEGWSFPTPNQVKEIDSLPDIQLYNLSDDPGEKDNLQAENQEKVTELKSLLTKYIQEGRSTPGIPQENDGDLDKWKQIKWIEVE